VSSRTSIPLNRWPAALTLLVASLELLPRSAAATLPDVCGAVATQTEKAEGIPPGLVRAVALAESGRWLATLGESQAWPWTVTSGGESFFFPSREAALRKVRELQAQGRSNIDVGCMQVNLGYHADAFASLEEAIEPASNIAYGARFLKRLRMETRSWARATARYHSSDPDRGEAYRDKVYRLWHQLRQGRPALEAPVRLAGSPPGVDQEEPLSADQQPRLRFFLPGPGHAGRPPPGAIAILRGR
jgi:hypothetical protein